MNDPELTAGTIAAKLRLLPDVDRLYPARSGLRRTVRSATALLATVSEDPAVTLVRREDRLEVEVSIGVSDAEPALETAQRAVTTVRESLRGEPVPSRVTIRIASIG